MAILYSCSCFAECQELEAFPTDLGRDTRQGSKLITGLVHARQPYTLTFTPRGNYTLIKLTWVTLKRGGKMEQLNRIKQSAPVSKTAYFVRLSSAVCSTYGKL